MLDGFQNNLSWEVHYEMTPIFSSQISLSSSFESGNSAYRSYDLDKILSSNERKNKILSKPRSSEMFNSSLRIAI